VQNKGIGPAIVKSVTIKMNGKPVQSFLEIFEALGDSAAQNYSYSTINGQVLSAGEKLQPFFY